ncbi:MAG: putative MFS family arabinose efflux permease [Flavobacteriales bacterium]
MLISLYSRAMGFLRQNFALLSFGFLCVFWGNFGQSFFVSWFGGDIQRSLNISASAYGSAYSLATLASAMTVVWAGALIDRVSLSRYSATVAVGLVFACVVLAMAPNYIALCIGFYLLRFFGQALFPHTGITTMARYFEAGRGKALSIAGSGVAVGEVFLPVLAVFAITLIGWRNTYFCIAVLTLTFYLPLTRFCLRLTKGIRTETEQNRVGHKPKATDGLKLLLKDRRYWLALPGISAAPFVVTGIFIHQDYVIMEKSWSQGILASSFIIFGVVHWLTSLFSGFMVDRFSARKLLPFTPMALVFAQLCLAFVPGLWVAPVFMGLLGAAIGFSQPINGALWAEVYGTKLIGSIRSVNVAAMVLASSISPVLFGVLIDVDVPINLLFGTSAALTLLANCFLFFSFSRG